ncbi:MAG: hypothetical protein ACP5VP_04790 [Candidatus Limnocylindrales bacterium]
MPMAGVRAGIPAPSEPAWRRVPGSHGRRRSIDNSSGTNYPGRRWLGLAVALALAALVLPAQAGASAVPDLSATLDGRPIPPGEVARHACHDRDAPLIRCFGTLAALEADEQAARSTARSASPATLLSPYVRWHQDANYGGASFDAYNNYADLATIGWDNIISSFKPLNGGHPVWWQGANDTGVLWDWGTVAQPTLGVANDQFSSVSKK